MDWCKDRMKIGAIIAEYNPFHSGHKYQIDQYRKENACTHLLAVMSGNFVQRGGPAIIDKFSRARMALENGVDLVVELPAMFSTQTAELFARGGILTLDALNCIDSLCYGSESGDLEKIKAIAKFLTYNKDIFDLEIKNSLKVEKSYARAREVAISNHLDVDREFLMSPNNILAIEYEKELMRINSDIDTCTIKRKTSNHNDGKLREGISSASSIRSFLCKNLFDKSKKLDDKIEHVRANIRELSNDKGLICDECFYELLDRGLTPMTGQSFYDEICITCVRCEEELRNIFEVKDGLENSIRKRIIYSEDMEMLIESLTNKTYSRAKISRCLFNILFNLRDEDVNQIKNIKTMPYIRVLGFNDKGKEILKKINDSTNADIILSPAKAKKSKQYYDNTVYKKLLDFDLRTSSIYYQKYYALKRTEFSKGEPDYIKLIKNV